MKNTLLNAGWIVRPAGMLAILLFLCGSGFAQVNIGSSSAPNAGAMLEVSGTTKGMLLPRVSLTSTTTWGLDGTQTAGMAVYNTNASITSGNDTYPKHPDGKGVYYWDGTGWISGGASNFSTDTSGLVSVAFVNLNNPNTGGAVFYTETDDNDAPISDTSLKSKTTYLYAAANGSTWIWNGSSYVTKTLPKANDHDWYIAKTTAAPTNINQKAYALGARGIGTNAPAYPLDVQQSKAAGNTPVTNAMIASFQNKTGNAALRIGNSTGRFYLGRTNNASTYGSLPANSIFLGQHVLGGGASKIAFGDGFGTSTPSVDMLIDAGTGNVGIGTTTTDDRLTVTGGSVNVTDDGEGLKLGLANTGIFRNISAFGTGSYDMIMRAQGGILFAADANSNSNSGTLDDDGSFVYGIRNSTFGGTFQETMRLTNLGHLKFPNNTKARKIVLWQTADNDNQFFGFGINASELRYQVNTSASDHVFYVASSPSTSDELMRITGTGNVGINNPTPASRLTVNGGIEAYAANSRNGAIWAGNSTVAGIQLQALSTTNAFIAVQRNASDGGWAGYFTRDTYVANSSNFLAFAIGGSNIGGVNANSASSVQFLTTSDERLKENIHNTNLGLADVMKIQVRDYSYKKDPEKTIQTGFIAQQLYTVYPQAVAVGNDDTAQHPWMVDYGKLTPLLTKAIQEQQTEIELLKAEIAELKKALQK